MFTTTKSIAVAALASSIVLSGTTVSQSWTPERSDGLPPQSVNGMSLNDYLGSREYWRQLQQFTETFERALGPCPTPQMNRRHKAVPAKQAVRVPGVGVPPQWVEILDIEGCRDPFRRGVFVFLINGHPKFMPMLHGTARSDPFLQVDVIRTLLPAARAKATQMSCSNGNDVRLLGAKFNSEQLSQSGMRWSETWRVADCHGSHDYEVRFHQRSGKGTSFSISEA